MNRKNYEVICIRSELISTEHRPAAGRKKVMASELWELYFWLDMFFLCSVVMTILQKIDHIPTHVKFILGTVAMPPNRFCFFSTYILLIRNSPYCRNAAKTNKNTIHFSSTVRPKPFWFPRRRF